MTRTKLDDLIGEITNLLNPVITKGTIVFIVSLPGNEANKEYAIFGNLPQGENQELVKIVALDMAMKDIVSKVEMQIAIEEAKNPETTVN